MSELSSLIERFYLHFCDEISEIDRLECKPLYKKLLYASMLDCLGKARYPNDGNIRILNLIDHHSDWGDKDRVSMVQLAIYLAQHGGYSEKLVQYVNSSVSMMQQGTIYRCENDPTINIVEAYALPEEMALANKFRYAHLFFHYRHSIVHEFRAPGHGMELSTDGDSPYYHSCIKPEDGLLDHNRSIWELVFPVKVFKKVCEGSVENLRNYFIQHEVNPYDSYDFDDLWIRERR